MTLGKDNIAGLQSINVIATETVTAIPDRDLDGLTISSAVTVSTAWTTLSDYIALYAMELREEKVEDEGDDAWMVEIPVVIPAAEADNFGAFFTGDDHRKPVIADVTDANGNRRLFGTLEQPLRVEAKAGTGSRPGTPAGMQYVIKGALSKRAPIYSP